jgi:hypothetical protein
MHFVRFLEPKPISLGQRTTPEAKLSNNYSLQSPPGLDSQRRAASRYLAPACAEPLSGFTRFDSKEPLLRIDDSLATNVKFAVQLLGQGPVIDSREASVKAQERIASGRRARDYTTTALASAEFSGRQLSIFT